MEQEKFSKIVWIVVEKLISSRPRTLTDFLLVISKISATLTSSFIISSPCLRAISLIVFIYLFFRKGFALSKVLSVGHSTISCNTFQLLFYLLFSYLNVFVFLFSIVLVIWVWSFSECVFFYYGLKLTGKIFEIMFWIITFRGKIFKFYNG